MPKRMTQFSSPPRRSSRRIKHHKDEAFLNLTNSCSTKVLNKDSLEDVLVESYPDVGFLKMSPSPFHKRSENNALSLSNRTPKSKQKLFVTKLSDNQQIKHDGNATSRLVYVLVVLYYIYNITRY